MRGKALDLDESVEYFSRIRQLINDEFGGNVSKAAKAWGVPQPTLWRIATCPGWEPKLSHVIAIADATGLSIDEVVR